MVECALSCCCYVFLLQTENTLPDNAVLFYFNRSCCWNVSSFPEMFLVLGCHVLQFTGGGRGFHRSVLWWSVGETKAAFRGSGLHLTTGQNPNSCWGLKHLEPHKVPTVNNHRQSIVFQLGQHNVCSRRWFKEFYFKHCKCSNIC